jgi:hypothetical protein
MNDQILARARHMEVFNGCSIGIGAPYCEGHIEAMNDIVVASIFEDSMEEYDFDNMDFDMPEPKRFKHGESMDESEHSVSQPIRGSVSGEQTQPTTSLEEDDEGAQQVFLNHYTIFKVSHH